MKPNKNGKFYKDDVVKNGYRIIDYGMTATDIKKDFGINIPMEKRLEYCMGFYCSSAMRGCVPVFDIAKIMLLHRDGMI